MLFDIWIEGYRVNGSESQAKLLSRVEAVDFKHAVLTMCDARQELAEHFNPETMTIWGCRLFPEEAEARASFG